MEGIKLRLSDHQQKIFLDRYALPGETEITQLWHRVAHAVAANDPDHEKDFYALLYGFRYVPGGRILRAMGSNDTATAMNCYVIPSPEDSRRGIMHSLTEWVEIQSKGGGVGINLSTLRPKGFPVIGVGGESSGPVNWAQPFAFISHSVIIQGGTRRGAAMIMLNDNHPDVFDFIHAKETPGVLEGCNVSVCISDAFMEAVANDKDWDLIWNGEVVRTVPARQLWHEICEAAWKSGEPGIYFMERANKLANSGYFEQLIATNPCGEQPLGPYGACLLGAFNLMSFMDLTKKEFKFEELAQYVAIAVRFNDNVIDLARYPLNECQESQQNIRRMGIGVMGLADALLAQEIRYGSREAVEFTEKVFRTIRDAAYEASAKLAIERGPFPKYSPEYLERPFIKSLPEHIRDLIQRHGIRNCYLLTQAPTGTTSLLAGVNSGIEPYFDFAYYRNDRLGTREIRSAWADLYSQKNRPDWLVTAHDLTPEEHIDMQAAAQKYIDSSVSKTVNAPHNDTVENVKRLYTLAYEKGLKSLAYYRDGSRQEQVLYKTDSPKTFVVNSRRKLPDERQSITHKFEVGGQKGYLTVGLFEDGTPGELFVHVSKRGSTINGLLDSIAMLTSYALQYGVPLEALVEKMSNTRFEPSGLTSNSEIPMATSLVDYIFRWLGKKFLNGKEANGKVYSGELCSECGGIMVAGDGCFTCHDCGHSKCG